MFCHYMIYDSDHMILIIASLQGFYMDSTDHRDLDDFKGLIRQNSGIPYKHPHFDRAPLISYSAQYFYRFRRLYSVTPLRRSMRDTHFILREKASRSHQHICAFRLYVHLLVACFSRERARELSVRTRVALGSDFFLFFSSNWNYVPTFRDFYFSRKLFTRNSAVLCFAFEDTKLR